MLKKILIGLFTIIGGFLGTELSILFNKTVLHNSIFGYSLSGINIFIFYTMSGIFTALIFYFIFSWLIKIGTKSTMRFERILQSRSASELIAGSVGLIFGFIVSYLVSYPISFIPFAGVNTILSIVVYIVFGYIGMSISIKRRDDFFNLITKKTEKKERVFPGTKVKNSKISSGNKEVPEIDFSDNADDFFEASVKNNSNTFSQPKILDTSVIIDGRIADIVKTGFVEGPLIIPTFVLDELRHISDSSDSLKRNRGRRGLDVLNRIQNESLISVQIVNQDFDDISEVDTKLIRLAQVLSGKVVTNDYNLNKVAEFQRVPVLNINELANAVKIVIIPGEEMWVQIVKEGKENTQGVGYFDDGTMIVVEGARKIIGENANVIVTSVLQTSAGRMIFAKLKTLV